MPPGLVHKRIFGDGYAWPDQLLGEGPTPSVMQVYKYLDLSCQFEFGRRNCTWRAPSTIATEMTRRGVEIARRTVLTALKWLEEHGWIARSEGYVGGRQVSVIWCLWLIPDEHVGLDIELGQGYRFRGEDYRVTPPASTRESWDFPPRKRAATASPDRAGIGARRAGKSLADAPKSAPDSSNQIPNGENDYVDSAAHGGGNPEPPPCPAPESVGSPSPAGPGRTQARKLVNALRNRGIVLTLVVEPDGGELVRYGKLSGSAEDVSAEELAELKRLKPDVLAILRGEPDRPPAPAPDVPGSATVRMIERLADPGGAEEVCGRIAQLAAQLADDLADHKSYRCYRKRLTEAHRSGDLGAIKSFIDAYKIAIAADVPAKGGVFVATHNQLRKRPVAHSQSRARS